MYWPLHFGDSYCQSCLCQPRPSTTKTTMETSQDFAVINLTLIILLLCIWFLPKGYHYISCNLADTYSDLQLIRLSRRHTLWSYVGLRALLKGPTAVQILSWPHLGSNYRPCGSKSSSLTTTLQATNTTFIQTWNKRNWHILTTA